MQNNPSFFSFFLVSKKWKQKKHNDLHTYMCVCLILLSWILSDDGLDDEYGLDSVLTQIEGELDILASKSRATAFEAVISPKYVTF